MFQKNLQTVAQDYPSALKAAGFSPAEVATMAEGKADVGLAFRVLITPLATVNAGGKAVRIGIDPF